MVLSSLEVVSSFLKLEFVPVGSALLMDLDLLGGSDLVEDSALIEVLDLEFEASDTIVENSSEVVLSSDLVVVVVPVKEPESLEVIEFV